MANVVNVSRARVANDSHVSLPDFKLLHITGVEN